MAGVDGFAPPYDAVKAHCLYCLAKPLNMRGIPPLRMRLNVPQGVPGNSHPNNAVVCLNRYNEGVFLSYG